jgi:hypothetical protein
MLIIVIIINILNKLLQTYFDIFVPLANQKIQLVDEIMMPKSEYDTVHEFIA